MFPDSWDAMLSIAFYFVIEGKSPLSRYPRWASAHALPCARDIPSQRSSELFASITRDDADAFCSLLASRQEEGERWFYDTTSISSYSETLRQVKWGRNKDHVPLPQINLAVLLGQKSGLPFCYRKVAGNIADVSTVKNSSSPTWDSSTSARCASPWTAASGLRPTSTR